MELLEGHLNGDVVIIEEASRDGAGTGVAGALEEGADQVVVPQLEEVAHLHSTGAHAINARQCQRELLATNNQGLIDNQLKFGI